VPQSERVTDLANVRILLVEDNERLRRALVRSLEEFGCRVDQAGSGEQALEAVRRGERYGVLLSDIRMPGALNGIALADEVVRISPDTRVLLQSGYYETGSTTYPTLNKPYTLEQLIAALQDLIGARRAF
jgi:CheY-like chemotaxis protein